MKKFVNRQQQMLVSYLRLYKIVERWMDEMKNFSMGKVFIHLLVVLVTAWSVFFIANYYHDKGGNQIAWN